MVKKSTLDIADVMCAGDVLEAEIQKSFDDDLETQEPSAATISFIMGYAAAYQSVESRTFGRIEILNN